MTIGLSAHADGVSGAIQVAGSDVVQFNQTGLLNANLTNGTGTTPTLGDNSTKLATTEFLNNAFASVKAANGYQKLPSGLILQWGHGTTTAGTGAGTITFPIAFPTVATSFSAVVGSATLANIVFSGQLTGLTSASVFACAGSTGAGAGVSFYWFAIGY